MVRIASLFIVLLLVYTGCGKKGKFHESGNEKAFAYSVRINTFTEKERAEKFSKNLKNSYPQNTAIQKIIITADTSQKTKTYVVEIGGYPTSFSAGMSAFNLFRDKIIKDYSITFNRLPVYDEFANIFIIGDYRKKPAVLTHNLKTGKNKVFWSYRDELVMELNSSKDGKTVFFLTASDYGRKTIFPYVNNLKVYRIDLATMRVEKLKNLGNAVQIFTSWETPGSFKIVFNAFDMKRSTFVNQTTLLYTTNGKLLKNEKVIYDITKEKYPIPHFPSYDFSSVTYNYEFAVANINNKSVLSLIDSLKIKKNIYTTSQTLNAVDWWKNGRYFIFSTYDISLANKTLKNKNPITSELCVYSTSEGKIVLDWKGAGYKNFLLRGDLLFFDDGFDKDAKILVFDLKNNYMIDTIAIKGGCGIKNIPIIPY